MANLEELESIIAEELIRQQEIEEKYPSDVPNDVCRHAFIRGIPIENSFGPKVGEYNFLCQISNESLFLWTYKENTNSSVVSQVDIAVKDNDFWKTAGNLIWLANVYYHAYEGASTEFIPDYKWMYYFEPSTSTVDSTVFYGLSGLERSFISNGTILNIHFDLKRKRTVEAQCFAAIIIREYITKHALDYEAAIEQLKFNKSLLGRVSDKMSTSVTL